MKLRNLPVLQNWDCHSCTNCCREYTVPVTAEERRRIETQGWEREADLAGARLFSSKGPWWARRYHLAHRGDAGCVFLGADNRCRIHARYGAEAKPLACRLFPFVLVPVADHWRISLRFACPSVAANRGRPLAAHRTELERLASLLQVQEGVGQTAAPPPPLQSRQSVEWRDLHRFVAAVLALLRNPEDRIERRWRKCLALAKLCRQGRFDTISGGKLTEFLDVLSQGLGDEVPSEPAQVPSPGWVGRVLFRQEAAVYSRKDQGLARGRATRNWLTRLGIGCRFAVAWGKVPQVNALLRPGVTFAALEQPAGPLPAAAEQVLERYYLAKVESLQFCGATGFGLPFWDGLDTLALTLPLILWLSRGLQMASRHDAIIQATSIVDDHVGFNRVLNAARHRLAVRILASRGELERLIAWYSR